jgi:lysyl-tRNA synthetase class 2
MIGNLDLGDLIAVKGTTTVTPRGEFSIEVNSWQMLAKSLRPPPDKRAGLEDRETRYRQRELDLIANLQSREKFVIRSKTITALRNWLDQQQFLEVETPVLQPLYGGAAARPFTTHHNTLDRKLFLRIATELYLKRCIVGGFDRVYEIGKDFRNEGLSTKHNPEFTMLEYYQAYSDYHQTADQFQRMISDVAEQVLGSSTLTVAGNEIDLGGSWKRITLRDAIMQETGHDIYLLDSKDKLAAALDNDNSDDNENQTSWAKMVDQLFSRHVEPKLIQPTFITDYPKEMSPFAKQHPEREDIVERWEAFIGGIEIANSFSELNDPDEQRQRFQQQAEDIADGDDEAQPYDQDFVRALEHGMPPTGGVGLGIDRLVMLLTDSSSLREVILFPVMR